MRTRLIIAALLAAASAAVMAQTAQPTQPSDQPRPTFRAEANYVRVDMYATEDGRVVEDLTPEEIEILEDGTPQKVESFEYIKVRTAGPQESRIEPSSVAESRQLAQDPRARVFIIFLDTMHVQVDGSHAMKKPVVTFLDRVIGQDDLVGVMTPDMSAADIALGRKTTVISKMMGDDWAWGRRDQLVLDPKEQRYESCYPPNQRETDGIADEMTDRRREKLALDAVEDLVHHLRGLREERKAVLMVSEGWRLFGENRALAAPIKNPDGSRNDPTGLDPVIVDPGGKLRTAKGVKDPYGNTFATMSECDADRMMLAHMENRTRFRELFNTANRANVSFYTIYPRGLAAFDSPIGPRQPPPLVDPRLSGRPVKPHVDPGTDGGNLRARHDSLRELASNTDGLAIIDTNNIDGAMNRIVSDLTSYYLLGYYSSNSKLDGRFREIRVRVKRPGVQVRARRGYRGATAEDLTNAADAAVKDKAETAVSKALAVATVSPRSQFRIRTAAWTTTAGDKAAAALWIVGELDSRARKDIAWSAGAVADLVVVSSAGVEVASKKIDVDARLGTFALRVPDAGGVQPGEYAVRIRVSPKEETGGLPVSDTARVIVPVQPLRIGEAVLWRRGPTTGLKHMVTADPRFLRSERVRLEHATTAAGTASARMLDRAGNPMSVPVQVTERQDDSGEFRWIIADAVLAPLAAGDYAIELTLDDAKVVTAFKVVP